MDFLLAKQVINDRKFMLIIFWGIAWLNGDCKPISSQKFSFQAV